MAACAAVLVPCFQHCQGCHLALFAQLLVLFFVFQLFEVHLAVFTRLLGHIEDHLGHSQPVDGKLVDFLL